MLTDIFVPLLTYPDATPTETFEELALLSQPFATSIAVCAFEIDIPDLSTRWGSKIVDVAGMTAAAEADSKAHAKALIDAATSSGITISPKTARVTQSQLGNLAASMARYHDMSVVGLDPHSPSKRALAEALIFGAGRPVLVAPEGVNGNWELGTIAIAWDGGKAASRAVHDAMPLIVKAEQVVLVTAFDDKAIGEDAVLELAEYLNRHGVRSNHHDVSVSGKTVGAALQQAAHSRGAGLLVMGAFGHSRVRDFIVGGATQSTLEGLKMPVFFSH